MAEELRFLQQGRFVLDRRTNLRLERKTEEASKSTCTFLNNAMQSPENYIGWHREKVGIVNPNTLQDLCAKYIQDNPTVPVTYLLPFMAGYNARVREEQNEN